MPTYALDDLSNVTPSVGVAALGLAPIGTSGATTPLLDGDNTWSGGNTFQDGVTLNFGSKISDTADGVILLTDAAGTGFKRLDFGGTTSGSPSIQANGEHFELRLADDSGFTKVQLFAVDFQTGTTVFGGSGDGDICVEAGSGTGAARIMFGDTSSAAPALKRSGAALDLKLSDDSSLANFNCRTISASNALVVQGKIILGADVNGVATLYNNLINDFDRLQFGGITSSFPAVKRNGADIDFRLADDSEYASVSMLTARTKPMVVTALPSASIVGAGARAFVTDATATTFASTIVGGGSNAVPVYSDGTDWRIG